MADSESHLYGEDEDEEMPMTERDLADDAQWKVIQKNTFTRWANEHLKTANKNINNLDSDLSDGLRLIALVEVLSGKKFKHVNKRPNFRTQKLENVTMVLEFLERDEGIRIVNIDSSDIVDCKLKLILGLIWTLILHYSISMPMWEGEEPTPSEGGPTPKQRLLNWVQSKVPDQPIKNFTTDWNDGRAIGALVDAVGPGLCPDWEDWNPKNAKKNAKEAMDNAEKWLDIPQLIKPEEITNPKVDELSMMTYLSQFPKAKLKPGAPVRPRLNPNRVRAYGPGLEPKGNQVGAPARFTVETFSAGKGSLEVTVLNPKGKKETCECVFNNDRNLTYSCVYVPSMEGEYKVIIKFGEREINKSPFSVKVEGAAGDPTKVTASGPGLEKTGVIATKRTYFEVFTKKAGKGSIDVVILDPHGRKDTIRPSISPVPGKEGTYLVEYIAMEQGLHSINIMFAGQQIPKSPYGVNVSPASNAKMCYATGRGIQPKGVRVNENADFKVHTKGAGSAEVKVHIIGPGGVEIKCTCTKSKTEEGVYECVYIPLKQGQYIINITFGEQHIAKSPFKVEVGPAKTSKIRAYGPGLEGGVVNQPARFTVETQGETGALGFSIEGPSQAKIDCKDNGDGSADVTYFPTAPGEYAVHILCNEDDIPKSPYMVQIQPETKAFNASKVTAFGPGLEKSGVVQNKWTEFTVDAKKAGKASLSVSCLDVDLKPVPIEVLDKKDGTFQCKYMPKKSCKHTITITWGGVQIPNSPFRNDIESDVDEVQVGEPSKPANVKVYGPGVEKGVKTMVKTYFIVDCTSAGPGDIGIALTDGNGRDVPVKTTDQKNGTFRVEYEPVNPGTYVVAVYFAGKEIPSSPIKVPVEASIDLSKVKVVGLDKPMTVNKEREIQIITKSAGKSTTPAKVTVTMPSKKKVELKEKPTPEGYQTFFTPTEVGPHKVEVTYGGSPVPKSPFTVDVLPDSASKVKAYGPGLKGGNANSPAEFTIDSRAATSPGELGVTIEGPKEAKIETKQNPDGTVGVTYYPEVPGEYKINVTYANAHIKDSPFKAKILPEDAANKVKCYGEGLTTGLAMQPATFTVDTREAPKPEKKIDVKVKGPGHAKVEMKKKPDTTTEVTYHPTKPGDYTIDVTYDGKQVKDSPFKATIKPEDAASKVKAYGPGLTGGNANVAATFTVDTKEAPAPKQNVDVQVKGPAPVQPKLTKKPDGTVDVDYTATKPGDYTIDVTYGDKPIKDSPFKAKIVPDESASKVIAYGPGLTNGNANAPATFTVDTRNAPSKGQNVDVKVKGPAPVKPNLKPKADGTIDVDYTATAPGDYTIDVTYGDKPIKDSPFKAKISKDVADTRVRAYGPGLEKGNAQAPCTFTIDSRKAAVPGPVGVKVHGPKEAKIDMKQNPDGTFGATYVPTMPGEYTVEVTHCDKPLEESPFKVKIGPPSGEPIDTTDSGVKAYGPGLKNGIADKPAVFTVDARNAKYPGAIGVGIEGPKEATIDTKQNPDGTVAVTYYPTEQGEYTISVTYDDKPIKESPFKCKVRPSAYEKKPLAEADLSGVKVYGPGLNPEGVYLDSPTEFTVDAKTVSPSGEGTVRAVVNNPSGVKNDTTVTNKGDGTYDVLYTPVEEGNIDVDVTYDNMAIPNSPFKVAAVPGCDASRVKAYGPGLQGGFTNQPQVFTIDIKGAGQGGLGLSIDGPSEVPINCKDNRDGTCTVEYLPSKPGEYDVSVKFADQEIPNSPFRVGVKNPVDAKKVKCYGPGVEPMGVKTGAPATFTVDTTEAGEAPLEVTCTDQRGRVQPAQLTPVAEGVVDATYYPVEEGPCKVDVKYANQHVPGSPFTTNVEPGVDASRVRLSGAGVQDSIPASLPVTFLIDTREAGIADLEVLIKRPDGTYAHPHIVDNGDGTFTVSYVPDDLGTYEILIRFGGQVVPNTPLKVNAYPVGDATKCRITDGLENTTVPVNKETVICVDASQAGDGKVTCRIRSPSGNDIDIDIVENPDGTFSILFTPQMMGAYTINIKFGGQSVPGGEYDVQVLTSNDWSISAVSPEEYEKYLEDQVGATEDLISPDTVDAVHAGAPGAGLFQPVDIRIPVGPIFNFVSAYVVMPSGKKAYPKIQDNKDGTVTVRYQPTEIGLHELYVKYNNDDIEGSPFKFHVDAINSGHVTAYGPGLCHGIVNEPAEFTIVTKDAGAGGLSLAIEGPSKTEIKCVDNGDGTCTVGYVPTAPGEYNVSVKFADSHIAGSPFTAKISPTASEPRRKAQIGRSSEVSLKVMEQDINNLTASIRSPTGREEPCLLKRLANGHLGISFTPREVGEHLVNVFRNGQHINGSPFKIIVGESELGNASKVRVAGEGLQNGMANEINEFMVDTRDAGYGGLSLSIEGPSKADIECLDNEDGSCRVTYKPTEPGNYIINIKFSDEHVPGSPFNVSVGGEPSSRMTERITRHREAADITHIGSQCELSLKIPVAFFARFAHYQEETQTTSGTSPFDMTASVTSPSGLTELCDIISLDDNHYSIKFVPKEMGVHTVSVKHKDMHIPGSPFEFTVGPITGGGSHKVHAAGPGLEKGEINQPCEFNIYTREAGAGGLSIAVEGPSKAELDFDDRKDGSCGVKYVVTEPGEYLVSVKFNDEHIPESPFKVYITPSIGDARKLSVAALQQKGLQVGKPAAFVVNYNGASKGKLRARVISPSGTEEEALIQEIDDGEYAVRFIPRENGVHNVFVTFDGCDIPDSPFRVLVGKVDADPGMVTASGDGLRTGQTGQTCKFVVNTCNAGAGALAVTVEGPSKVKLECKEVDEGYEFTYSPTAPGDYMITIRYAGVNIAGSPFKAKIEGQGKPSGYHEQASVVVETVTKTSVMSKFSGLQKFQSDASRCTAEGNGLKKAFRGKQATFSVDTSQAGNNMMFVGMMGPKGPCEELCVKNQGGYVYKINYIVRERGDYMLVVKWGDQQIPGSPFCVHVD
ncbi:filamin-C-like isoform X8 [Crassostrea angulata]|uniref:filamin-C-like isoform X8 n=1 Tax=Magallana angulata TaxID=2784310 RepID=UPI0022B178C4|nr:filamin-C-like isoform X8 [Crassostrea angulata]